MNGVVLSESKTHLLGHVRSLRHYPCTPDAGSYPMRNFPKDSGEYLSALCNIRSLELANIRIENIGEEGFHTCFSAFRETLTDLTLMVFVTSFSAFVTLVDYFPNITTLRLSMLTMDPEEGPVPSLSRPLRGKISLCYIHPGCVEFFDRLAGLDPEYEELVLDTCLSMDTKLLESILQLGASAVKYLRLTTQLQRKHLHYVSFSLCALTQALTF